MAASQVRRLPLVWSLPAPSHRLLLAAALVAGGALRLLHLGDQSYWYDELFTLRTARLGLDAILAGATEPVRFFNGTVPLHPFLSYLLLHVWRWGGEGEAWMRLLSVLLGVATIGVVFLAGRAWFDRRTGAAAALICALAPFQVLYAQEVRMYALAGLLAALSLWSFGRLVRGAGRWTWCGFTAVSLAGAFTLYTLGLLLPVYTVFLLSSRRTRPLLRPWFGAMATVAAGLLLWLVVLRGRAPAAHAGFWPVHPSPLEFFRLVDIYSFNATNLTVPEPVVTISFLVSTAMLLLVLDLAWHQAAAGKYTRSLALTAGAFLGPTLGVLGYSIFFPSVYVERGLLPFSIPYYLLLARMVAGARRPGWAAVRMTPALLLAGVSLFYYFSAPLYQHYQMREAAATIAAGRRAGDVVLHTSKLSALPVGYYLGQDPALMVPDKPDSAHNDLSPETARLLGVRISPAPEAVAEAGRVWLVVTLEYNTDYHLATTRDWLQERFPLAGRWDFVGVSVFLYDRAGP